MRNLEVPFHFSGLDIQRNHRTAEQVASWAVAAIVIVGSGRIVGGENDAALPIHGHRKAPLCSTWAILVAFVLPSLCPRVASLLRDRAEFPNLRARAGVECARRSWIAVRAGQKKIFVDEWRGVVRN